MKAAFVQIMAWCIAVGVAAIMSLVFFLGMIGKQRRKIMIGGQNLDRLRKETTGDSAK